MPRKKKIVSLSKELIDLMLKDMNEKPAKETIKKLLVLTANQVFEIRDREEDNYEKEIKEIIEELKALHKKEWDVDLSMEIEYFDPNLSYELSGYKPIDAEHGLDFDPEWFLETRTTYNNTGHYCMYPRRTKAFNDFWDTLYRRCRDGMTVNGYTVTGDHYFFLNFYLLDILTGTSKAGGGRLRFFPNFFAELYKYFHYLELCKRLRKNCVLMKARGVGQR